ncbi:hypothetical protein LCGC14_1061420 [marine sediment metagenome]|uniref:Uncharacterized protein n=1 Tax=marine sediment metagenome TaxID=412755 RepID=A0A0F9ML33_9ZZZZ
MDSDTREIKPKSNWAPLRKQLEEFKEKSARVETLNND